MAHFHGLEFTPLKAGAVRQRGQHGRQIPVCATLSEQVREGGVGVIEEQIGRYACMKCVACTLVCNHTGSSVTSVIELPGYRFREPSWFPKLESVWLAVQVTGLS